MASWITHSDWDSFVWNNWEHNLPLGEAITNFAGKVAVWNREVFGNIFRRKKSVLAKLGGIQKAMETHSTRNLRTLELELREELEDILLQEEMYMRQKANSDFINLGDQNAKYFHARTKSRMKHSHIEMIRIGDNWCSVVLSIPILR